jgi:hypothetical protein
MRRVPREKALDGTLLRSLTPRQRPVFDGYAPNNGLLQFRAAGISWSPATASWAVCARPPTTAFTAEAESSEAFLSKGERQGAPTPWITPRNVVMIEQGVEQPRDMSLPPGFHCSPKRLSAGLPCPAAGGEQVRMS